MAALLSAGIPAVAAAQTTTAATTSVLCTFGLITAPPAGQVAVTPGIPAGHQFGNSSCGTPLGKGVVHDSFTLTGAGNFKGSLQEFFGVGSLTATMNLAPFSNLPPTPTTFSSADYYGTVTVAAGTGSLRGVTGSGSMRCTSTDQIHYSCKERLKLTQAVAGSTGSLRRD